MHTEKLHCFVLSSMDYGDSDRIVSLFTLEHGRIRGFARGARKSRKRFGAALETFARIDVQAKIKEGLSGLQQADIHNIYPHIRSGLDSIAHALYACELIEVFSPEGQALPRLFRLLSTYLDHLEISPATESDRRFFEINLLNIMGYRPSIVECSNCGSIFGDDGAMLQIEGELVCRNCTAKGQQFSSVALRSLQACLKTGTFGLVSFADQALLQAGKLLDIAIGVHAGRSMKSADFLRQISP